jgi:hypothetical protein
LTGVPSLRNNSIAAPPMAVNTGIPKAVATRTTIRHGHKNPVSAIDGTRPKTTGTSRPSEAAARPNQRGEE